MTEARTLFNKIWESHVVFQEPGAPSILYIDLHLVHEVTSPQAFDGLRHRTLGVRRPARTFATIDHSVPTQNGEPDDVLSGNAECPRTLAYRQRMALADEMSARQMDQLEINCREFGVPLFGLEHPDQGIVHIIGPELGLTQPGMTIVCGDSHTATHGAFGALAFGIGTSEVEHVLATQCLLQNKPKTFYVRIDGELKPGVTAKDVILAIIAQIGTSGGVGHVIEYTGSTVRDLSMEERMTLCNMSIEAGARAGMISPDDTTFEYLAEREYAPRGVQWDQALRRWGNLATDEGASYDKTLALDVSRLEPMITFGTNPAMGMPITARVPDGRSLRTQDDQAAFEKALAYMGLQLGQPLLGQKIDVVFIGSCTNGRISDLRQAAGLLRGRRVAEDVRVLVVPGSQQVKRQAEAEGLAKIFLEAGAEWREPGCSMCIAMNGDQLQSGQYAVSTNNRNFEGRQGKGGRTFLASPLTAAAAAITGQVTDPRTLMSDA